MSALCSANSLIFGGEERGKRIIRIKKNFIFPPTQSKFTHQFNGLKKWKQPETEITWIREREKRNKFFVVFHSERRTETRLEYHTKLTDDSDLLLQPSIATDHTHTQSCHFQTDRQSVCLSLSLSLSLSELDQPLTNPDQSRELEKNHSPKSLSWACSSCSIIL